MNIREFRVVRDDMRKTDVEILLPKRGTAFSAGYDFYSPITITIQPNSVAKIWTDVKAYMHNNEMLLIDVRSSMGGKFMLNNTIAVIDSDYADNIKNDGNIRLDLRNISDEPLTIYRGDRIAQGIFVKYLITDDDDAYANRIGGFGSTN